jgi:O-antigen/teichoic acid export membrane protein
MKSKAIKLLKWSEKYTKTDMLYLAKGGFWLTVGQAVSSLSAFALAITFANLVPPETYGTYKYLLSIAAIFSLFTLPGMGTAVARAVARGDTATTHKATHARVLWSLIGTFFAFGGSAYYFINGNIELTIALAIIGVTLPVFDTFTLYNSYLAGKREFKKQTYYHVAAQLISTSILITTLFFTDNVLLILLAYFVPLLLTRFIIYIKVSQSFLKKKADKETLTYGKHLSIINIFSVIAKNTDKILLWHFLGPAQVAIYAFAIAIPEQIKGPLKGMGTLAFPKFATKTPEEIRENLPAFWRKLWLYAFLLSIISIAYIILAPLIFKLIFPQYLESVFYSQIFAISLVSAVSIMPITIIEAQKKTTVQYLLSIIQPTINILLFIIFIPPFGLLGAIGALTSGRILSMGISIFIFAHILNK